MFCSAFTFLGQSGLRWTVGDSSFDVLPEYGARLMRWRHAGRDIIHWPETRSTGLPLDAPANAADIPGTWGGNPLLFPFTARCFDKGEPLFWRTPDGTRHPMPMHGIARQGHFEISHLDTDGFDGVFQPDAAAREAYPFDYTLVVRYRFSASGLVCELILHNREKHRPIPWSAGQHFYFSLPSLADGSGDSKRKSFRIRIPATQACTAGIAEQGRLTPQPVFPPDESLAHPQLANAVIHYGLTSNESLLYPEASFAGGWPAIVIRHGEAPVPPPDLAFVTWSPSPEAPFYCIEPWMGPSNAPAHGVGLHWVPPGEKHLFAASVSVV